jgi:guanylate kinase
VRRHRCAARDRLAGARQVKAEFPHAVGIFILPPSIDVLEARLHSAGRMPTP